MIDRVTYWQHNVKELAQHIGDLLDTHPEIKSLTDPWDLYGIRAFDPKFQPSRAQLNQALEDAKAKARLGRLTV